MARRVVWRAAAIGLLAALVASWLFVSTGSPRRVVRGAASATTPCGVNRTAPKAPYAHVIWIVFENKDFDQVIGSRGTPYLNSLARRCGLATNYHAVAHPSLPNYIALTSGSTQGIADDFGPSAHQLTSQNIFSQVGRGWRALEQSMPRRCDREDSRLYAVRHNPAVYYAGLRSACTSQDAPLLGPADLRARFLFVTPNVCSDMHSCSPSIGDKWLSRFLPRILDDTAYRAGRSAVFLTWDEADSADTNRVPLIAVAPSIPAGGRTSALLSHYSLLRTTESMLGLPCLAAACAAPPLSFTAPRAAQSAG